MPPAGNSHSNDNNDMTDGENKDPHQESDQDEDVPGASKSTSSEDGSDPVMISPHPTPEKPSHVDMDNNDHSTERFEDSMEVPEDEDAAVAPPVPSFVRTGLQHKASPWQIENWIALSLTLDGRDKITKTLQYVSRLAAWWFVAYGAKSIYAKNQSQRFTALYKALSESRKAFRLGRSITEAHKIASMGLVGLWCWHLKRYIDRLEGKIESEDDDGGKSQPPKPIVRRASSNIGWGPMTLEENDGTLTGSTRKLVRTVSSMAYRTVYRPMISRMSSTLAAAAPSKTPSAEWWMATGSALKMLGLLGFWMGDNVNFLTSNGAMDNYRLSPDERAARRKRWQTLASEKANQAYFVGAIAGLVTNAYAYHRFRKDELAKAKKDYQEAHQHTTENHVLDKEEQELALKQLKKLQEKQFSLFLALLKSCVDVTVFSNNPGIDLHQKFRGKKNHEGLHCLCGLISAGTVLYNNFPDAVKK
jgi:Peroxisomal biogenesis factor 11 (PEX11)